MTSSALRRCLERNQIGQPFSEEEAEIMLAKMEEDNKILRNEEDIYLI
jgi:phosphoribosyl-ATP pyrophosphohydrolase